MNLFGKTHSRRDIEALAGRLEQVAGVRRMMLTEGPEAGVELIEVRTGGGLRYHVVPQRGLDISLAEFRGAPISWQSPNGEAHPAHFEEAGTGWLRTAAGGLLMTCGLTQVGSPCEDMGEALGIHGRIHHTPAREVAAQTRWIGNNAEIAVSGTVSQTRMFGEVLLLERTISSPLGENRIIIHDVVRNAGAQETPLMMLYHFNFGWPLLTPEVEIHFPSRKVRPREVETPLEGYSKWETPRADYRERVYYHEELQATAEIAGDAAAQVLLRNTHFPTGPVQATLSWTTKNLPRLVQWKMPGAGVHVLGIEPANCWVGGRAAERAAGTLQFLKPGESIQNHLTLEIKG